MLEAGKVAAVEKLYDKRNRGEAAEGILRLLDPMVEERLALLLNQLQQCPPELGPLLDLRAKISELWRLRKELKDAVSKGNDAREVLEGLMLKGNKNKRPETGQN